MSRRQIINREIINKDVTWYAVNRAGLTSEADAAAHSTGPVTVLPSGGLRVGPASGLVAQLVAFKDGEFCCRLDFSLNPGEMQEGNIEISAA